MAEQTQLEAQPRTILGKKVRQLRREGLVPANIYGPAISEPIVISVDAHQFQQIYRQAGTTNLVDLKVDGDTHTVFIREVQIEPIHRHLLHVDFYAPNLRETMVASVPVVLTGELRSGVQGVLSHGIQTIDVRALPANVPSQIEVDISVLDEENPAIVVGDVATIPDAEVLTPHDEEIIRLMPPRLAGEGEEEAAAEEGVAAEAPAETETAEG